MCVYGWVVEVVCFCVRVSMHAFILQSFPSLLERCAPALHSAVPSAPPPRSSILSERKKSSLMRKNTDKGTTVNSEDKKLRQRRRIKNGCRSSRAFFFLPLFILSPLVLLRPGAVRESHYQEQLTWTCSRSYLLTCTHSRTHGYIDR